MGRKTIKMDPAREDYDIGSLLEKDERFETDAEWHGRVLGDIESTLSSTLPAIEAETAEMAASLNTIANMLWEISAILTAPKNNSQPITNWQFIFNWIMILLIFCLFKIF